MPVIQFDGTTISKEKKEALVMEFAKATERVLGIPPQYTTIILRENSTDNIGVNGMLMTDFMKSFQK